MRRKTDDSPAAARGFQVILEAVVKHEIPHVHLVQLGKVAEFNQQSAQVLEASAQYLDAIRFGKLRHRHLEIPQSGAALASGDVKTKPGQESCGGVSGAAGQKSEEPEQHPGQGVFDEFFNTSAHPWYFHILL
jgi:hypothetical protein